MLLDVDTDLQQLAISLTVLHLQTLTIMYLLLMYTHNGLQQLSLKLSMAKPESSHASYDELDCCWKIRNPNHQYKIMKRKPRLLFWIIVHRNKPNGMFYVSCSIATVRSISNWKYSKVTTDEAFQSTSCYNSWFEWFLTTCSQTLEAVIKNWYKSSNDNPDCNVV